MHELSLGQCIKALTKTSQLTDIRQFYLLPLCILRFMPLVTYLTIKAILCQLSDRSS